MADEPVSVEQALEEERAKAERYLANWQRAQADFDNYKKRIEQEQAEGVKLANMSLIMGLLPVLDDFSRAFDTLPPSLAGFTWIDGVRLIERKLQATLEARGLQEIRAVGEQFDPKYHEAVMQVEGEDGKVMAEAQKGYMLYDRVLRPSLVVVGKALDGAAEESGGGVAAEALGEAGGEPDEGPQEAPQPEDDASA